MTYKSHLAGLLGLLSLLAILAAGPVRAAPYAAMVMDARTGEVLHARNADTRLHPASLTKMMTLYIVFEAVRLGEITMDTRVTISRNAAATAYALGFQAGSEVELRFLVRAAAVRSSNDAAVAIAEAISGSEAAFARRMNRTAEALGMTRTTFRNPHGLTAEGHLSTARDMTIMGRRLFYDYPQYYNIFGRSSTYAGPVGTVPNTNRAVLGAYRGADGIKTGFTRAAGFNLTASAERDGIRILATVFGGNSAASRNERIMELLDMGFARAPARVTERPPALPDYGNGSQGGTAGRVIRMSGAVSVSLIPTPRPGPAPQIAPDLVAAIESSVDEALAAALAPDPDPAPEPETEAAPLPGLETPDAPILEAVATALDADTPAPDAAPDLGAETQGVAWSLRPHPRPIDLETMIASAPPPAPEIVTRSSSSGVRLWGVSLGNYPTENAAERALLTIALSELDTFDDALRNVTRRDGAFVAQFAGMTEAEALRACLRLETRDLPCVPFGPS